MDLAHKTAVGGSLLAIGIIMGLRYLSKWSEKEKKHCLQFQSHTAGDQWVYIRGGLEESREGAWGHL